MAGAIPTDSPRALRLLDAGDRRRLDAACIGLRSAAPLEAGPAAEPG